ncbi:hypothetical protein ITP53_41655 [Nonomuraea sp. K274]|uniref:Uncharacterized protein n=1 Tax=Nonomuraea cypriaca TaxID=1187855 RepID=A0A931F1N8_9ACTN|nr:hypothetical protein [Nonomuraea cypriaca]MBF8192079.1 hypothetical protein [Nonomuraea cypriaca]
MSLPKAAMCWASAYHQVDEWISGVVEEARDGVGLAPAGGVRPGTAPVPAGSRGALPENPSTEPPATVHSG